MDKNIFSNIKANAMYAATIAGMYAMGQPVFADWDGFIKHMRVSKNGVSYTQSVGRFFGLVLAICKSFGAVVLIWGMVRLFLSLKSEDPEAKQRAIMSVCVGCLLFGFEAVLRALNLIN